jgi:type I restriction enzyme M protein
MAIKKSELYSHLWKSCDALRGGLEPSQYKDYVLVLLFIKYVSDKYAGKPNALVEVPEGGSFQDISKLKGKTDIGDGINKVIAKLAEANELKGVIDVADFNNSDKLGEGKAMVDRLSDLVRIFEKTELNFSKNQADGDDILGDAYEYLMKNFATESGKSKGQFYTPAEVSRIMAKVIGVEKATNPSQSIYDPTCGSGSLLIKAADETNIDLTIYGQEEEMSNHALAKMNMILHSRPIADIRKGDTLVSPRFKDGDGLKTFDFAVANPPFSDKSWSSGFTIDDHSKTIVDEYKRFDGFGVPPSKNGDYAFLLHFIKSLKSKGKGAIILPHGVLFRGNVEGEIRKALIKKGFIKGIVGLPPNLFFGTGIPACIIVLDKEGAENREGIFMINASKGFIKDGNKNRLRERDIHRIVDVYNKCLEVDKYSKMVPLSLIEDNEYNLNIPRYIDSQDEEDIQDIDAHLKGGIPKKDVDDLENYWGVYSSLRNELFKAGSREGYLALKVEAEEVRNTIFNHPEFTAFSQEINKVFQSWRDKHAPNLKTIVNDIKPKKLIHALSEDILEKFSNLRLIDEYDIYQHLLTYWMEVMRDDVYMIMEEGWKVIVSPVTDKNGKSKKGEWTCELIPKDLVIQRYFKDKQEGIFNLTTQKDSLTQQMEELKEEHSGEDGLLEEVVNEKGNITKGDLEKRIKEIKNDSDYAEEYTMLKRYFDLNNKESLFKKKIQDAEKDLDKNLLGKYKSLTESEIKTLVVDDKWMATIESKVTEEMERISQRLAGRIKELAERYQSTLPELTYEVDNLTTTVDDHLKKMGFVWG